jgi:O-antigen ligase
MRLTKAILLRAAVVVLPSTGLLAVGRLNPACYWFYAALAAVLAYDLLLHRHLHVMATLLACTPLMILLRGHLLYSGPQLFYVLALAQAPLADLRRLRRNRLALGLLAAAALYWGASWAYTGIYAENYRAVELALTAILIYLLAQHRTFFRPALLGFSLCAVAVGAGLLPNGAMLLNGISVMRLGLARVSGSEIGNPISFGTTLAAGFLLTVSSGGSWLGLAGRRKALLALQAITVVWLLLSTSRGSWAVAVAGLAIIFWTEPKRRPLLLAGAAAVVALGAGLLAFTHDTTLTSYLDRTFSSDVSLAKLTTGRSVQWASFPAAWEDAPIFGHGPGTSLQEGRIYFEHNLIYHALFLQIGVETGTAGLALLFLFFYLLFVKAWRYYRLTGDPVALIGSVGYVVVSLTVPGLDAASGSLLGLGLLGSDLSGFYVVRRVEIPEVVGAWPATAAAAD